MTEKTYLNPFLAKAKELNKKETDPEFNPLTDDTPEGTADIEDLDEWVKTIADNKKDLKE